MPGQRKERNMQELQLIADVDERARKYLQGIEGRPPFPNKAARDGLTAFTETLPEQGLNPADTLRLLDTYGSPATTASNGPRYFGFVIGAALPAAAAAERLMLAWDQCASSYDNSPVAATIEKVAASWLLEVLDLHVKARWALAQARQPAPFPASQPLDARCWRVKDGTLTEMD